MTAVGQHRAEQLNTAPFNLEPGAYGFRTFRRGEDGHDKGPNGFRVLVQLQLKIVPTQKEHLRSFQDRKTVLQTVDAESDGVEPGGRTEEQINQLFLSVKVYVGVNLLLFGNSHVMQGFYGPGCPANQILPVFRHQHRMVLRDGWVCLGYFIVAGLCFRKIDQILRPHGRDGDNNGAVVMLDHKTVEGHQAVVGSIRLIDERCIREHVLRQA